MQLSAAMMELPGSRFNIKTVLPRQGYAHVENKTRSRDRRIFNMRIHILVRRHLDIETDPGPLGVLYRIPAHQTHKVSPIDTNYTDTIFQKSMRWPSIHHSYKSVVFQRSFMWPE